MLNFSRGYSKIKVSSGKRGPFVALFVNGLHIPGTAEISAVLFYYVGYFRTDGTSGKGQEI